MGKWLFIAFTFLAGQTFAQKDTWHRGVVVTSENAVITGELFFHAMEDVLVIRHDSVTRVLCAATIRSFNVYDQSANINRKFISLSDKNEFGRKRIYEVVVNGAVPVIRRLKSEAGYDNDDEYLYYFIQDGEIKSLRKFRSELYPDVHTKLAVEEKNFHLNPNRMADAIRFIMLYNRSSAILASR
ncbi:hypothetical protein BH09BAC3_BH09BAC3_14010 [soil metagenome]